MSEIGPNFVSSRKAWQKINSIRSNQSTKGRIPCLYDSGLPITEDAEKANIFKEILKKRFSGEDEDHFDRNLKQEAEKFVQNELHDKNKKTNFEEITLWEL